jgi:ribosomal protein S12 methylthiotransferase
VKTKLHPQKIGIVSLGCAKNLVDTELLMKQLDGNRFQLVMNPSLKDRIDTAIINTCGFILDAKKESIETILEFARAKQNGSLRYLFVMGCLPQRYQDELEHGIPEVDGFFGVDQLREIIARVGGQYRKELTGERMITTPSHYSYLRIAEGCDRKCSFCTIPFIRGKHDSRPMKSILREAKTLAESGVKELNIISQDTTYYGLDRYHKRMLPDLMEKLSQTRGVEWIRLHYTYPDGFPLRLLDVINDHPNICRYIDIPVQHISSRILRSMKRGMDRKDTIKLLETIRKKIPGVALRSTLITGYPGETKKEFGELRDFVIRTEFDRLGVFTYSHEEGTASGMMADSVPEKVKQERADELMSIQQEISLKLNRKKTGKIFKVIIDRKEDGFYIGRTEFDSPEVDNEVLVKAGSLKIHTGEFYNVLITGAGDFDLTGEIVK